MKTAKIGEKTILVSDENGSCVVIRQELFEKARQNPQIASVAPTPTKIAIIFANSELGWSNSDLVFVMTNAEKLQIRVMEHASVEEVFPAIFPIDVVSKWRVPVMAIYLPACIVYAPRIPHCKNCNCLPFVKLRDDGLCGACAGQLEIMHAKEICDKRHKLIISNELRKCARCNRSELTIVEEEQLRRKAAEGNGFTVIVHGESNPALYYCASCKRTFCGRCLIDLGQSAGCPNCNVEAW